MVFGTDGEEGGSTTMAESAYVWFLVLGMESAGGLSLAQGGWRM